MTSADQVDYFQNKAYFLKRPRRREGPHLLQRLRQFLVDKLFAGKSQIYESKQPTHLQRVNSERNVFPESELQEHFVERHVDDP